MRAPEAGTVPFTNGASRLVPVGPGAGALSPWTRTANRVWMGACTRGAEIPQKTNYLQRNPPDKSAHGWRCPHRFLPQGRRNQILPLSPGSTMPPSNARGKKRPAEQLGLPEKRCIHHGEAAFSWRDQSRRPYLRDGLKPCRYPSWSDRATGGYRMRIGHAEIHTNTCLRWRQKCPVLQ